MKANHILILAGVSLAALAGLAIALPTYHTDTQTFTSDSGTSQPEAPQFNPAPVIHEYALDGLPSSEYPQLTRLLGKQGMKIARQGVKAAAYRAARTPGCDAVENANVSQSESTRDARVYFVNCDNHQQYRIEEQYLRDEHGHWYTLKNAPPFGY